MNFLDAMRHRHTGSKVLLDVRHPLKAVLETSYLSSGHSKNIGLRYHHELRIGCETNTKGSQRDRVQRANDSVNEMMLSCLYGDIYNDLVYIRSLLYSEGYTEEAEQAINQVLDSIRPQR